MKFSGSHEIDLSQETLWNSLRDVDVLEASIPGCESFERIGLDAESYRSVIATKIGPIKTRFAGKMDIELIDPPNLYKLVGSGSAGSAGAARGEVLIKLRPIGPERTCLAFDASVAITGRMAQIGGKMIHSTAEAFANQFFQNLSRNAQTSDKVEQAPEFSLPPLRFSGKRAPVVIAVALLLIWLGYVLLQTR
jgi:uncharacterized protein